MFLLLRWGGGHGGNSGWAPLASITHTHTRVWTIDHTFASLQSECARWGRTGFDLEAEADIRARQRHHPEGSRLLGRDVPHCGRAQPALKTCFC